jgi:hypothetical protein
LVGWWGGVLTALRAAVETTAGIGLIAKQKHPLSAAEVKALYEFEKP